MTREDVVSILHGPLEPHSEQLREMAIEGSWRLSQRFAPADLLVYDNYNFVVSGWTYTGKPGDAFLSLAVASYHASICFLSGVHLSDPEKRLRGGGNLVRNLRLDSLDLLEDPYVSSLIDDAAAMSKRGDCQGRVILKSVSAKKRRPRG